MSGGGGFGAGQQQQGQQPTGQGTQAPFARTNVGGTTGQRPALPSPSPMGGGAMGYNPSMWNFMMPQQGPPQPPQPAQAPQSGMGAASPMVRTPWNPLPPMTMNRPAIGAFVPTAGVAKPAAAIIPDKVGDPHPQAFLHDDLLGTVGDIKIGNLSFRSNEDIQRFNTLRRGSSGGAGSDDGGDSD